MMLPVFQPSLNISTTAFAFYSDYENFWQSNALHVQIIGLHEAITKQQFKKYYDNGIFHNDLYPRYSLG